MDLTSLPPKPDRQTGEPRPPHAPVGPQWKPEDQPDKRGTPAPAPPDGQGPTLEWHRDAGVPAWFAATLFGVLAAIVVSVSYGGVDWVEEWWAWLVVVLCAIFPIPFTRPTWYSAGADWYRPGNKRYLKTYELISVKITPQGAQLGFDLQDRDGQVVLVKMEEMQKNRELWDLVYNGILHSVYRNGAETNTAARNYLHLEHDQ